MNIKSAWIGANKTIPKYGHYSTMGENEISCALYFKAAGVNLRKQRTLFGDYKLI